MLISGGWVLPKRPNTPEGIAADEMVGVEFEDAWGYHIKKFLNMSTLLWCGLGSDFTLHMNLSFLKFDFEHKKSRHISVTALQFRVLPWYNGRI